MCGWSGSAGSDVRGRLSARLSRGFRSDVLRRSTVRRSVLGWKPRSSSIDWSSSCVAGEPCHADKKLSMVNEGGGVACGRSVGIMTRVVAAMVGIGSRGRGAC